MLQFFPSTRIRRRHYGVWTTEGAFPTVLYRNVGAPCFLHDGRNPPALHHRCRAWRPRSAPRPGKRDLRALPRLRLLHAVSRRDDRRPLFRLPQIGRPRRVAHGRGSLPDGDARVQLLCARSHRPDHRKRLFQAEYLGHGGQPLRARRPQERFGIQYLLHGNQHRRAGRHPHRRPHRPKLLGLAVDLPRRRPRRSVRRSALGVLLEVAGKGRPQARTGCGRYEHGRDLRQDPRTGFCGRHHRLFHRQAVRHADRASVRFRIPARDDPGHRLLCPARTQRQRRGEARALGPVADLCRGRCVLHDPPPQRQRHDPVGARLHRSSARGCGERAFL